MIKIQTLVLAIGLLSSHWVFSQNLQFNRVEIADNKVIVHYDLNDEKTERMYLVNLFSSQDNFTKELTKVSGDVGTEVKPGVDKKIVWDLTKELGNFKGDLVFEVRGLPRSKEFHDPKLWTKNMDLLQGASVGVIVECEGGHVRRVLHR